MDIQNSPINHGQTEPIASVGDAKNPLDLFGKIVIMVVALEIIVLFVLNFYENNQITAVSAKISTAQSTLSTSQYSSLNNQVSTILSDQQQLQSVLDGKVKWSNFYSMLNNVTPQNVQLSSITANQDGSFKASGQASSLNELAQAITVWSSGTTNNLTPFTSVTLDSESYSSGSNGGSVVTFSVSGQINLGEVNQ